MNGRSELNEQLVCGWALYEGDQIHNIVVEFHNCAFTSIFFFFFCKDEGCPGGKLEKVVPNYHQITKDYKSC